LDIGTLKYDRNQLEKQKNPITVIRLYNTILLNPHFEVKSFRRIQDILEFYIRAHVPFYDLAVQFLALSCLAAKGTTPGLVEAFRLGLEMLHYNANHPEVPSELNAKEKSILNLTREIQSAITVLDPY
jgi:hypothetical protein